MARLYTKEECLRKSDQHWEMAGLARQDNDMKDAEKQTEQARLWHKRAFDGGYSTDPMESKSE